MKKIFTLTWVLAVCFSTASRAQVVLNEMYGQPGATTHEFFELFNTSTDDDPISVDGFTVMTYFDDGTTKGFYVLDLPAMTIAPRGYFVGSAAKPFSYQGVTNSTSTHFNWNDPLLTSNSGYLKKWVYAGNDASDGNKDYNLAAIPSGFNDLFAKRSGGGIGYSVFIFQNGILINNFYGSAGGTTSQPSFITNMPKINLQYVVGGTSSSFNMNFGSLSSYAAEYVGSDAGTDNGYIRTKDGLCGTWDKSSASVNHTPGVTNGASVAGTGTVTITATITRAIAPATTSTVYYDVTSGASSSFPIELQVYRDNGSVAGQLDATDTYLASNVQNSLADPGFSLNFSPANANILVIAKTAAGCFGQVKFIGGGINSTLPVKLISFNTLLKDNRVYVRWTIDENETAASFVLQRSTDGKNFYSIANVEAKDLGGMQTYQFTDRGLLKEKLYYRLQLTDKQSKVEYSKILSVNPGSEGGQGFALLQNPVTEKLYLSVQSEGADVVNIRVIDVTGRQRLSKGVPVTAGTNLVSIDLPPGMTKGLYMAAVQNDNAQVVTKFVKN